MGVLDGAGLGTPLCSGAAFPPSIPLPGQAFLASPPSPPAWDNGGLPYRGDPACCRTLDHSSPPPPILNPEGCSWRPQENLVSVE